MSADRADVVHALRAAVRGGVDDSVRRRAEYSSDASNYRVVPQVVVFPRDVDDVLAAAAVARATSTPLTLRGGGTSVAGNAIGTGIVLDTSRHLYRIVEVDPQRRTARVEPGVVLAQLQAAARPFGLRFGPDPSTQARATLGGMIGNNACGPHAIAYGRTADNVAALDVVDGTGRRFEAGRGLSSVPGLRQVVGAGQGVLRGELGRFTRQMSGYAMEHLLPEAGEHVARALVGSEGTLVTVLGATVDLVPLAGAQVLVVLGYPDMPSAADAAPALLAHRPLAVEGIDARLVGAVRRRRGEVHVPQLPDGGGWLLVEVGGDSAGEAEARAAALAAGAGTSAVRVVTAAAEAAALWRIREDGAGLSGRTPSGKQAWPGWEDAAVPVERLGRYLREFDALLAAYGLEGLPYGHFGDGCVHVRVDLPLDRTVTVATLREFVTEAASLVVAHGGSFSGEHGDGRARSELLPLLYSAEALDTFASFKALLDPADLLNPGVLVRPRPLDADLRRPQAGVLPAASGFAFANDAGDFTTAVHRCVGVGTCRADTSAAGGFMCPSFLATRDERDSTRGRARVLQEMANGTLVSGGWRAAEVADVLDLCLSCKACASDCPAGVDMATYKAEVLHRAYRRRVRPRGHYTLGWLPRWARAARIAPGPVNALLGSGRVASVVAAAAGIDPRRQLPPFAPRPGRAAVPRRAGGAPVVLWVDSFTAAFAPDVAAAALRVLSEAGFDVTVPRGGACCGLTWITTGQLDAARRRLRRLVGVLGPYAEAGVPIVGLEPSCTAVLRSDLLELTAGDARAAAVAKQTHTLAEVLTAAGWSPPDLAGVEVLAQPHCHHHAVMGYGADRDLLTAAGAEVTTLAGCCGMAGSFGMERGHYDVSVAVAEAALLPALRTAAAGTVLLADGFSCRTQAADLAGAASVHLAQLLAGHLDT